MSFFTGTLLRATLFAGLVTVAPVNLAHAQNAVTYTASADQALQSPQPVQKSVQAVEKPANAGNPVGLTGPEQRVALVIGNSSYQNVAQLTNPANDARAVAQLLNTAGFEVISATDLNHNEMVRVLQDFSGKIASRGPNTVAMVYYAGHGVQLAGENYLVPVDWISSEPDLISGSVRLVDVMATLETIPSRMRIVVLDACRNNPFPSLSEATRGLAIVDAPNGSIVGYSTAPGAEALDGAGDHSPYAAAFLRLAQEKNVPIEQLFKRIRLEVNNSTDGRQTPWESSSLTSDFYFFGDTAVAAASAPARVKAAYAATDLPSRASRQAYDYVLAENSIENYEEFIRFYPRDPLCDRIRSLLSSLVQARAWHDAVRVNSPGAYKAFYSNFSSSPYAQSALRLEARPKIIPLSQPTQIIVPVSVKLGGLGISKDNLGVSPGTQGRVALQPGNVVQGGLGNTIGGKGDRLNSGGQIVSLPSPGASASPSNDKAGPGKITNLPGGLSGGIKTMDALRDGSAKTVGTLPSSTTKPPRMQQGPYMKDIGGKPRFASTQFHGSAPQSQARFGGRFGR